MWHKIENKGAIIDSFARLLRASVLDSLPDKVGVSRPKFYDYFPIKFLYDEKYEIFTVCFDKPIVKKLKIDFDKLLKTTQEHIQNYYHLMPRILANHTLHSNLLEIALTDEVLARMKGRVIRGDRLHALTDRPLYALAKLDAYHLQQGLGAITNKNQVIIGDAYKAHSQLPDKSIDCIITSPPYFQKRFYEGVPDTKFADGWTGQLGLEPTAEMFVGHLVELFEYYKSKLKDTGSLWVNLGDKYNSGASINPQKVKTFLKQGKDPFDSNRGKTDQTLPESSLLLIPARFALAMMEKGWILRNEIVWAKPNAKPESTTNRFANKTERWLFFTKKPSKYYFDLDSVREPYKASTLERFKRGHNTEYAYDPNLMKKRSANPKGKNPGDVTDFWAIANATAKSNVRHYAKFNTAIVERIIKAACPPKGVVLDTFAGTGTTLAAAKQLGRTGIAIEAAKQYKQDLTTL